jgi:hypothetical protein
LAVYQAGGENWALKTARRKRVPNESRAREGAESLGTKIKEERGGDKSAPLVKDYVTMLFAEIVETQEFPAG